MFPFDWHFRIYYYCYVTSHHKIRSLKYFTFIFMKRLRQQVWVGSSGFKLLAGLRLHLEALEENSFQIHSCCKNSVPHGCWSVVHIFSQAVSYEFLEAATFFITLPHSSSRQQGYTHVELFLILFSQKGENKGLREAQVLVSGIPR